MGDTNNVTNSTLQASNKSANKVDGRLVGPLVAAIGLVLIIVAVVVVQAVRAFRSRRRKVYHVTDKVLKNGIVGKKHPIESDTAIENNITEDELVQTLHYEHSTEHLITSEIDYTTFTSQPTNTENDIVTELPHASEPAAAPGDGETSQWREASHDQMAPEQQISEEHFIPRANPFVLQLKKQNKITPLVENTSQTSSITSGSTPEITDEELIIIGTAIKSCPNFGRENTDESIEHDRDEPSETISYPTLTQNNDDTTRAKTSISFQLQEISSASETSSAADNFYQLSADTLGDIPCTEAIAVNRKDLWSSQDVVSEDVIIINN